MHNLKKLVCWCVIASFLSATQLRAQSVDDPFAQITPTQKLDSGEFVHGQGYGRILIRVLMFGSIPKQGVHYVPEGTDLLFAILYAGGYGETSSLNGVTIRRRHMADLIKVDLEDMIEDGVKVPKLSDGDVVTVPYNWRHNIATITLVTSLLSSLTGLTLSLIAFLKSK